MEPLTKHCVQLHQCFALVPRWGKFLYMWLSSKEGEGAAYHLLSLCMLISPSIINREKEIIYKVFDVDMSGSSNSTVKRNTQRIMISVLSYLFIPAMLWDPSLLIAPRAAEGSWETVQEQEQRPYWGSALFLNTAQGWWLHTDKSKALALLLLLLQTYLKLCLKEELLWALGTVINFIFLSMDCKDVLLQFICLYKNWNNIEQLVRIASYNTSHPELHFLISKTLENPRISAREVPIHLVQQNFLTSSQFRVSRLAVSLLLTDSKSCMDFWYFT